MINRKNNCFFAVITVFILLAALIYYVAYFAQDLPEIDFLDIGQGDASLIKLPNNKVILIDGGPNNLVLKRLGENLPFYQRKIDLIILSHFHDDHLIGLIEIIKRYKIGTVVYLQSDVHSQLLSLFIKLAQEKNIKVIALENRATINYLPSCALEMINPFIFGIGKDDNNSIVTRLTCTTLSALFSGDNNFKVEEALLQTGENWHFKIFKASHHGSKTANSENFLKAVNPSMTVISVGAVNRFGHPSQEILDRLESLGLLVKRTDLDGTVKIKGAQ